MNHNFTNTHHYIAVRGVVKMTAHIKIRTYSKNTEQLWLDEWSNPLQEIITISDPAQFLQQLTQPVEKTTPR